MSETPGNSRRIDLLDVARGVALLAMASYHFTWDLEFFGYAEPGMTAVGGWKLYARGIASTFLFLVGVSLVLAHGDGIRWNAFWRRFLMVGAAALAISVATYFAMPDAFIFFGILHEIALGSLLALAFLRLPAALNLLIAAAIVAAPNFLRADLFNHSLLWWLGLAPVNPRSNDYVPIFPWFGAILAGVGITQIMVAAGIPARLAGVKMGGWAAPFRAAGRHSLAFYLIHQPVLLGCIWLFSQAWPAAPEPRSATFVRSCEQGCAETRDAAFCKTYCGCVLDSVESADMLDNMFAGTSSDGQKEALAEIAAVCTADTEQRENPGQ